MISIRHLELPIIHVVVGEGEGDYVTARVGDVEVHAVGRVDGVVIHRGARRGGDVDGHLAEVLGEDHREDVAVDGGLDAFASIHATIDCFSNYNNWDSFTFLIFGNSRPCHTVGVAECRRKEQAKHQDCLCDFLHGNICFVVAAKLSE